MIFKVLDAEKDVVEQGFHEGSYDLIVASNVLHATARLDDTLRNARRLLKPGGYLLIAEVTCADVVRVRFPFSALPGWWRGHDDGRPLTATINTTEWHQRLCRAGFSGIDTVTPEFEPLAWPSLIILSQAVDDRISFLRQPLYHQPPTLDASPDKGNGNIQHQLVLVGGQTMQSCSLLGQVSRILAPWFAGASINRVRSLADLNGSDIIGPTSTVINFSDLDNPALENLTEESFAGLKKLVERPHCLLWITSGCRERSPTMNMSVGLGRVLIHEIPGLRLQFLDVDAPYSAGTPRLIAETFLRWRALAQYESDEGESSPLLWGIEHELVLEKDVLKAPRITYDTDMNLRYNASRKLITHPTDLKTTPVYLRRFESVWKFERSPVHSNPADNLSSFDIMSSSAVPCYGGFYVALGMQPDTDCPQITLSTINGSRLLKSEVAASARFGIGGENWKALLSALILDLQALSILDTISNGTTLLLHEPSSVLVESILSKVKDRNIKVAYSTTATRIDSSALISKALLVAIGPHSPTRLIKSQLPPYRCCRRLPSNA
ncbi:polyketide synthase/peptide synthetase [Colletotrichum truncatum]|uniref:Polyketide synthase/peptide synthetase n=1 Tax=Colletotrichum truncatum TaxID=5467 RepID=A0ACC3YZZ8_COLTU|nr:polyketide synthase/peptide synthetase [Colletotrichum truncatum]KAF6800824.1 polyketide synthase/peptide synthetase [Colletotrichum truncatum]